MFRYLLPALIPSWRFFDYIRPSPRIEFTTAAKADDPANRWQEFRPRPVHLSIAAMVRRLLWNPQWNESLFMVTCAERLLEAPSAMREDELLTRIAAGIARDETGDKIAGPIYLIFRIVTVEREGEKITQQVRFVSRPLPLVPSGDSASI